MTSATSLTSGTDFLVDAAKRYFSSTLQGAGFSTGVAIDKSLSWAPSLSFKVNNHKTMLVEASETPYPLILSLRRADVMKLQLPISVYCICPEQAYLDDQAEAKRLIADGFGLLTVDALGVVQCRADCIPLVQQIADSIFSEEVKGLPLKFRARLAEAFARYKHDAPSGVSDITEVIEAVVLKAGRDAVAKNWLQNSVVKDGFPAQTLQAMQQQSPFKNATAAIGAVQGYISQYRNTAHHAPKDKKQAHTKYRDCRHAFLDGLKKISMFRDAMKGVGLSGGISVL